MFGVFNNTSGGYLDILYRLDLCSLTWAQLQMKLSQHPKRILEYLRSDTCCQQYVHRGYM